MRKKLLIALSIVVGLVLLLTVLVAMQPSEFHIARSATVVAHPAAVYPYINNLQNWNAWSPWAELDPNAKYSFEGPEEGEGAVTHWAGNEDVGEGTMTITESRPNELVEMRLEFVKPFEDTCTVRFALKPEGEQTQVTWSMDGKNNLIGKAMCLVMNMDEMMGGQMEQGLENLKQVVAASPSGAQADQDNAAPAGEDS